MDGYNTSLEYLVGQWKIRGFFANHYHLDRCKFRQTKASVLVLSDRISMLLSPVSVYLNINPHNFGLYYSR